MQLYVQHKFKVCRYGPLPKKGSLPRTQAACKRKGGMVHMIGLTAASGCQWLLWPQNQLIPPAWIEASYTSMQKICLGAMNRITWPDIYYQDLNHTQPQIWTCNLKSPISEGLLLDVLCLSYLINRIHEDNSRWWIKIRQIMAAHLTHSSQVLGHCRILQNGWK
jgi:uncharacterized protein YbdZ (MbtH family)